MKSITIFLAVIILAVIMGCSGDTKPTENKNPIASFTISPKSGTAPLKVSFDASESSDSDGLITKYTWDYGDDGANKGDGVKTEHTYNTADAYSVTLTVTDNKSATNSKTEKVTVNSPSPDAPPNAPTNVKAIAGESFVEVTWEDNSNNEEGFIIYREVVPSTSATIQTLSQVLAASKSTTTQAFSQIAEVGKDITSYKDSTAKATEKYSYAVAAKGKDGKTSAQEKQSGDPVSPTSPNTAPEISKFEAKPASGEAPLKVTFSWQISDKDGDNLTCAIDANGNGIVNYTIKNCTSSSLKEHTYNFKGSYAVELMVIDGKGGEINKSTTVNVSGGANPEIKDLEVVQALNVYGGPVTDIAYHPNGKWIAAVVDTYIHIQDVNTGAIKHTLSGHRQDITSVAFSPDGKFIASGSWDDTIKIWQVSKGNLVRTIDSKRAVISITYSPNGELLASANQQVTDDIKLWKVSDGSLVLELNVDGIADNVAFSPDGKLLAAAGSASLKTTIRVFQVSDGGIFSEIDEGRSVENTELKFSPDGTLLATSNEDNNVRIWNLSTKALKHKFSHDRDANSVAFSPDGNLLASGSFDGKLRLWKVSDGSERFIETGHPIKSIAFSAEGNTLATSSEYYDYSGESSGVHFWRVSDGAKVNSIMPGHSNHVSEVVFSPDSELIAPAGWFSGAQLLKTSDGSVVQFLKGHKYTVRSVDYSSDGKLVVTGGTDNTIKLWRVSDGSLVRTLEGHSEYVNSVTFSPDNSLLASGSDDKTVKLWRVSDGSLIRTEKEQVSAIRVVTFNPDGDLLAHNGSSDGFCIKIKKVSDGSLLHTLAARHQGIPYTMAFSPNSTLLVSQSRNVMSLWDVNGGSLVRTMLQAKDVNSVAFSPDGSLIASGNAYDYGEISVKLWKTSDGSLVHTFLGYPSWTSGNINSLAFSPNGKYLAVGTGLIEYGNTITVYGHPSGLPIFGTAP